MSHQVQSSRNRVKTRTGCPRCKQRRIKCDETHPQCIQCTRRGFECPGYKRALKWSSKYELGAEGPRAERRTITDASRDDMLQAPVSSLQGVRSPSVLDPHLLRNASSHENFPASNSAAQDVTLDLTSALLDIELPGESQGLSEWTEWESFSGPSTLPVPLQDQDTGISWHYFVQVCRINSCVDSDANFFRVDIGGLMASSPLIYHCVLAMSAAHLTGQKTNMLTTALDHRTKAHSYLTSEITNLKENKCCAPLGYPADKLLEALLGSILLGMTDGWHNPSFLGTSHLHGARILFEQWISSAQASLTGRLRDYVSGLMAYWEAMASFVMNQSLDALSYFDTLRYEETSRVHPNPWTGICTPLFVYLARVSTLARQRTLVKQLSTVQSRGDAQRQLHADLLQLARDTESALVSYQIPSPEAIEDPGDPMTPVAHLQRIAHIYRLSALVELYRNFPSLLEGSSQTSERPISEPCPAGKICAMSISILNLIAAIPLDSGTNCLLTVPLLIAGSTLQSTQTLPVRRSPEQAPWDTICAELLLASSQNDVQEHWQGFVRSRLQEVRRYVGIAAISRASEILEKVWARNEVRVAVGASKAGEFVQWIEVMVEEKLETVLG
ncbi:fungal-specific transcription factor domain-containing protein [Aspergillus falconensis]